jgi:hypothetical protein
VRWILLPVVVFGLSGGLFVISFVFALWKQTKNIKNILDVPSLEIWTAAGPRMMVHQQDEEQQEE